MAESADRETMEALARLEAIRAARVRAAGEPSLADRTRYRGQPAALKRAMAVRADPTVKPMLARVAAGLRVQGRVLALAGEAVKQAVSKDLSRQVCPIAFQAGTLVLAVPDDGVRFRLDRELRAGGRSAIERALPAAVKRIKVVVNAAPVEMPDEPRRAASREEEERERWEEIDAGEAGEG